MENNTSFTEFIKDEIINHSWTKEERLIVFFSFLRTILEKKDNNYVFKTTHKQHKEKFNNLFKEIFDIDVEPKETKTLLKYVINDEKFINQFNSLESKVLIKDLETNKAFLAGIVLGKGWLSSPRSRFYHFEVRVKDINFSIDIQEALDAIGIRTINRQRNGWFYTYIKKSSDISTLISAINAPQTLMFFEDSRIERDFVATYKKMESIEEYNQHRSEEACQIQVNAINIVKDSDVFNKLSIKLRQLAELRLEKQNYSLSELQMEYNIRFDADISKSTICHWLRQIIAKANGGEE